MDNYPMWNDNHWKLSRTYPRWESFICHCNICDFDSLKLLLLYTGDGNRIITETVHSLQYVKRDDKVNYYVFYSQYYLRVGRPRVTSSVVFLSIKICGNKEGPFPTSVKYCFRVDVESLRSTSSRCLLCHWRRWFSR